MRRTDELLTEAREIALRILQNDPEPGDDIRLAERFQLLDELLTTDEPLPQPWANAQRA